MKRPIAISLSPNCDTQDVFAALKMIFSPWAFLKSDFTRSLEQWFRNYFKVKHAVSFASGRGALLSILKAFEIKKEDEILVQAFTCAVVPNVIVSIGAKPVFLDINNQLTIDISDLKKKITSKTKAIIVQHTFGIPSDLQEIIKIAKEQGIKVIEDCAHTIGVTVNQKKVGEFGDASFFSFGRDKAFSSVFGGIAITDNEIYGKKIRHFQKQQGDVLFLWILQQLFHPIAFYFILPVYNFLSLGKIILVFFQYLHFLSFPVSNEEKMGKLSNKLLKRMPNALSYLALIQLKKIKEYNQKREEISKFYLENLNIEGLKIPYNNSLPFLRFPILVENRDRIIDNFKKKGIYLGKWYSEVIDPKGTDFEKIYYKTGSCPNAQFIADRIINLPTYPTMSLKEANKVVDVLKLNISK